MHKIICAVSDVIELDFTSHAKYCTQHLESGLAKRQGDIYVSQKLGMTKCLIFYRMRTAEASSK